jgi:hypothetical protein
MPTAIGAPVTTYRGRDRVSVDRHAMRPTVTSAAIKTKRITSAPLSRFRQDKNDSLKRSINRFTTMLPPEFWREPHDAWRDQQTGHLFSYLSPEQRVPAK